MCNRLAHRGLIIVAEHDTADPFPLSKGWAVGIGIIFLMILITARLTDSTLRTVRSIGRPAKDGC